MSKKNPKTKPKQTKTQPGDAVHPPQNILPSVPPALHFYLHLVNFSLFLGSRTRSHFSQETWTAQVREGRIHSLAPNLDLSLQ